MIIFILINHAQDKHVQKMTNQFCLVYIYFVTIKLFINSFRVAVAEILFN